MLPYKASQLDPNNRITYRESLNECFKDGTKTMTCHAGQLKLFYSELLFLTKYAEPGDKVVYVGAAEGYHTNIIAELFPKLTFDLYDLRKFHIDNKWIKSGQITLFHEYFTDTHAQAYAETNERILFICDMRDLEMGKYKSAEQIAESDLIVMEDMQLQMKWCQMIKPAKAYLKFRLPYEIPKIEYLSGTIYLQPYIKLSTEARLCTSDYDTIIEYDTKKFDEMLAWHNAHNRCHSKGYSDYEPITRKYNIVNNWDNCFALMILGNYLKKFRNKSTVDDIGKLFLKVYYDHKRMKLRMRPCEGVILKSK